MHKKEDNTHEVIPSINLLPIMSNQESERVLIKTLIASISVHCEERGWSYASYFLEKAQESLTEIETQ